MIATMISGRLKEPATRRLTDKSKTLTTAQMIATDDGNRAQLVLLETLDDDIGRSLRLLLAGASLTVTGAATVLPLGRLKIRVRTVATLAAAGIQES